MASYEVRQLPWGNLEVRFQSAEPEEPVAAYDLRESFLIDVTQHRNLLNNANFTLPINHIVSLLGDFEAEHPNSTLLRLTNGPFPFNLAGTTEDFEQFAVRLGRTLKPDDFVMKARWPTTTNLEPFMRALRTRNVALTNTAGPRDQHLGSVLEGLVLNQSTRRLEIASEVSHSDLMQLRRPGQPNFPVQRNITLQVLSLELSLETNITLTLQDATWLGGYMHRFEEMKRVELGGVNPAFVTFFLGVFRGLNQQTRAGRCLTVVLSGVYATDDIVNPDGRMIPRTTEPLVCNAVECSPLGFTWIKLGHELFWADSPFRRRLRYIAGRQYLLEGPHLRDTPNRRLFQRHPDNAGKRDIFGLVARAQHTFPPTNWIYLFPETNESEIPFNEEYLGETVVSWLYEFIRADPLMLERW